MRAGLLGSIHTPKQGNKLPDGVTWCADNGVYGKGFPGNEKWLAWLESYSPEQRARCLFAVAPDVVGDAAATLVRSTPWLPVIRALGYPAAFVAQDGLEDLVTPWDSFDVLFIGGSTQWKLGRHAIALAAEAKRRGKWVHAGRVNSARRLRFADAPFPYGLGADSSDGTFIAFGPDVNLPRMLANLRGVNDQMSLEMDVMA